MCSVWNQHTAGMSLLLSALLLLLDWHCHSDWLNINCQPKPHIYLVLLFLPSIAHIISTVVALCKNHAGSETDIIITRFKRKLRSREAKWSHPNCREGEQWHQGSNLKQFSTLQRVLAGVLPAPWTWKWLKAPDRWNPASSQVPIPGRPQSNLLHLTEVWSSPLPSPLHVHTCAHTQLHPFSLLHTFCSSISQDAPPSELILSHKNTEISFD